MSKASDETRELLGIVNVHSLLVKYATATGEPMPVAVVYRPQQMYQCAAWQVDRPGFETDPDAAWSDYKLKTFNVFSRKEKLGQLDAALEWAAERYGVDGWAKTSRIVISGSYVPTAVMDWFNAQLKAARAAKRRGE